MRAVTLLSAAATLLFALVGCAADDSTATDDSSEINEGRGVLERTMDPPLAPPTSPLIGASMEEVFTQAKATLTAGTPTKGSDGCVLTSVTDPKSKSVVVERVECATSDVIRTYETDGTTKAENYDLNKDGKVDRFTGHDGAVVQYTDSNFDGKVDAVVELVAKIKDFSLAGYGESFPKSAFLYRVREDRNRDGKLDHEKLTARGALPAASSASEE